MIIAHTDKGGNTHSDKGGNTHTNKGGNTHTFGEGEIRTLTKGTIRTLTKGAIRTLTKGAIRTLTKGGITRARAHTHTHTHTHTYIKQQPANEPTNRTSTCNHMGKFHLHQIHEGVWKHQAAKSQKVCIYERPSNVNTPATTGSQHCELCARPTLGCVYLGVGRRVPEMYRAPLSLSGPA